MQDRIYKQLAKIKAVERWENEGGRICSDDSGTAKVRELRDRGNVHRVEGAGITANANGSPARTN